MVASPNPPEALLDPGTEAASSARAAGSCVLPKRARRDDFTGAHAARAAARRAAHRRQRRRHRLLPASGASGRVLLALPPAFGRLLRCSSSTAGSAGRQPAAHRRAAGHRELPPQLQVGLPRGWHHARAGKTLHDFRRTGVANLIDSGCDERTAMLISGHKTASMLARYNIRRREAVRRALQQVGDYVAGMSAEMTITSRPSKPSV